jgi:hypothetical protein
MAAYGRRPIDMRQCGQARQPRMRIGRGQDNRYRDPSSEEIHLAWDGSREFIGRHLRDLADAHRWGGCDRCAAWCRTAQGIGYLDQHPASYFARRVIHRSVDAVPHHRFGTRLLRVLITGIHAGPTEAIWPTDGREPTRVLTSPSPGGGIQPRSRNQDGSWRKKRADASQPKPYSKGGSKKK